MLIVDTLKIKYIQSGYLPNWPYHLISDLELINAFIVNQSNYFDDNYKIDTKDEEIIDAYDELKANIMYHVNSCLEESSLSLLPEWVFSYMIGSVVCSTSELKEIDDLIALSNLESVVPSGVFNDYLYKSNISISSDWLSKLPEEKRYHRSPSVFGEPHVIKSLRLSRVDVLK